METRAQGYIIQSAITRDASSNPMGTSQAKEVSLPIREKSWRAERFALLVDLERTRVGIVDAEFLIRLV